ncbi:tetraspanin-33 [Biomphalaria pfeifferi]|uniref:Tetraspanin-33 n=1 Tax=Biomphalaria pfeifferi TaxID=112525 RepID=A0AAD8BN71_BIOPF|nr:tetraspanin-33 [Biomphalaria pfeifferi]
MSSILSQNSEPEKGLQDQHSCSNWTTCDHKANSDTALPKESLNTRKKQSQKESCQDGSLDDSFNDCKALRSCLQDSFGLLPPRTKSPCSLSPDTDQSPSEMFAPSPILPEERDILSPLAQDSQFTYLDVDSSDSIVLNDVSTGDVTMINVSGLNNVKGLGVASFINNSHKESLSALKGEELLDKTPNQNNESAVVTLECDNIFFKASASPTSIKTEETPFKPRRWKSTSYPVYLQNRKQPFSVASATGNDQMQSSSEATNIICEKEMRFIPCHDSVVQNTPDAGPQVSVKSLSEMIKDKSRRNKQLFLYKKSPFWQTDNASNQLYRANTPILSLENDQNSGIQACTGLSSADDTDNIESNGALIKSNKEERNIVQDEMLAIIKELRRLSNGERDEDLHLSFEKKRKMYGKSKSSPSKSNEFSKSLSPISETNNSTDERVDQSKSLRTKDALLTDADTLSNSDKQEFSFFLNERAQTMESRKTGFEDQNLSESNLYGGRPIRSRSMFDVKNEELWDEASGVHESEKQEINVQDSSLVSQIRQDYESPSKKRVSFCLEENNPDSDIATSLKNPPGDSSFANNLDDCESKKLSQSTFRNINDFLAQKMNLRKCYSLSKAAEKDHSDEEIKVCRIHSLPHQGLKNKEMCTNVSLEARKYLYTSDLSDKRQSSSNDALHSNDGTTNLAFIKDLNELSEIAYHETSSENENEDDSDYDNNKDRVKIESLSRVVVSRTSSDENKSFTLAQNATLSGVSRKTQKIKLLKPWFSLDSSVTETTPLATSFLKPAPKSANGAIDDGIFSFEEDNRAPEIGHLNIGSVSNIEDVGNTGRAGHVAFDDQDNNDEDTLSLEFFVPVKKQYIRLHRSTFFRFVLKYSIFFLTFIFWVASVTGIAFGTWMLMSNKVFIDDITDIFLDPYVLLSVVGGIIFLISFFGCVGALRENILLLKMFYVTLTIVLVLECLLSTLVFLFYTMPEFRQAVKVGPEEVLKKAVKDYFDDDAVRHWIDTVQKEFQCCGVSMSNSGYLDWQENIYFNCSTSNPSVYRCSVPISCCIFEPGEYINYRCGANIMNSEEPYIMYMINTKGCMKSFGEWLGKNDAVIGYVALGVIIPQILGVVAARYFVKLLQRRSSKTWRKLSDTVQITSSNLTQFSNSA